MVVRVSVVHPPDRVADWDSSQESIVPHITSLGKDQTSKCVSTECLSLLHQSGQKTVSQTIVSRGPFVQKTTVCGDKK